MDIEKEVFELKEMISMLLERTPADETSSESFGSWLLRWYELYKKPKNGVNTSRFMYEYITKRISPSLGDIPLNKLTGDQIQLFLNGIQTNNTRQKIALIIRGSLTKALKLRLLRYNPFDSVELSSYKKKHYRPLSLDEQGLLLSSIKNKLYRSIFVVLICTGMRIGEFLALDESSVDKKRRTINVFRSVDIRSGKIQNRTKTYTSTRRIPYLENLLPYLNVIFKHIRVKGSLTYNQIKLYFSRLYRSMGMKGLTLHSLRHTFGCMCYRAGVSDKMIQRIMGHASLDVTMNIYVDVLGNGFSPLEDYFKLYKNDTLFRPSDFWVLIPPEN